MSDYRNLEVWKKAHSLTLEIYKITNNFPSEERYGLTSQIRRASSSVPMNIAEGSGSLYGKEFIRFLDIARRSTCEVEYQLLLCRDIGYIDEAEYTELNVALREVARMLTGLIKSMLESNK
ncbi:MAG: four helix bundle protein [Anaerosolibacter sp.]|uniref:four helix bundle protein n=1 Tax=Anaerosolibacter sp. TaxID=1872527 RepID=UPI002620B775|nr:four helix bundle protein [Anaerosolibacter sp.]MDF2545677.1 four helix bundle protein [Anaerosolibacter sp.]